MTEPVACSQCAGPGGAPVTEADFDPLADPRQVAAAGGTLALIGLRASRRFSAGLFRGLEFCATCRNEAPTVPNPFLFPKVCAGAGFFLGLTLVGSPLSFLLYAASVVSLRRRLRAFRDHPRAGFVFQALDAVGTLTLAVLGHVALLLVLGGAVVYLVYFQK